MSLLAQAKLDLSTGAIGKLPGVTAETNSDPQQAFGDWISRLMEMVMLVAALLVLLNLVWGAIEWISAGGDKSKIEKARNRITQSVIGIVVLAATLALFMALQSFLGIKIFSFSTTKSGNTQTQNSTNSRLQQKLIEP